MSRTSSKSAEAAQYKSSDEGAVGQIAGLDRRLAALRQAANLPGADPEALLDAAFTELDGAVEMLTALAGAGPLARGRSTGADVAERRLLRAAFAAAPVPLFLLASDGTVLRVNNAAGDLLGSKPGYSTGRLLTAFVSLPGRATVQTQLTAVARNGTLRRVKCALLSADGPIERELLIGLVSISGEASQLIVAVADSAGDSTRSKASASAAEGDAAGGSVSPASGTIAAITQRMDMVTAVTRLLLENENFSESMTLQRCARLLSAELAAWVIVDLERRQRLRRQFVIGPAGPEFAEIAAAAAAIDPVAGTVPRTVHESGRPVLVAHAEDAGLLGPGPQKIPLLMFLGATSVLSVPLSDGTHTYGVLTLARQAGEGHFEIADLALVEELGEQLALAIRVDRMFRRRTEIADALQASLLPRRLPEIPGVELAVSYLTATQTVEVGADFYDAYQVPGGWGLSVGDVCGKGEEAAAVTSVARHAIRVIAHRAADPAEVLFEANEILLAEQLAGGFVTAGIAHLRWQDGTLRARLGTAGHPGAAVIRGDGRVEMTRGGGLPLGLFADPEPALVETSLATGDLLFLYTDGVIQARAPDGTYFHDRLPDELAGVAGRKPDDVLSSMRSVLTDFSAGELADDITMVALRVGDGPPLAKAPTRRSAGGARGKRL